MEAVIDFVNQALAKAIAGNRADVNQVIAGNDPAERRIARDADMQELIKLQIRLGLVCVLCLCHMFYGAEAGFPNETLASKLHQIAGHGFALVVFQILASCMGIGLSKVDKRTCRQGCGGFGYPVRDLFLILRYVGWLAGI